MLNAKKTEYITYATKNSTPYTPDLAIDGTDLQVVATVRFLGIMVDSTLSWHPHITLLCKKLSSAIYLLRNLSFKVDDKTLKTVYFALFESHLRYGIECWGGSSDADRVFKLQKRAIRTLVGSRDQRLSCRPLYPALKILTLPALYILGLSVHVHKLSLPRRCDMYEHDTRNKDRLYVEGRRLACTSRGPSHRGALFLNKLPLEVVSLKTKPFAKKVKELLIKACPYSVDEFLNFNFNVSFDSAM